MTELQIETRVGPKGPERSSERHLRVQKWRRKSYFLAKSSGKNGVSLRTEDGRGKAAPLLAPPRSRPCLGGYNPPHSNKPPASLAFLTLTHTFSSPEIKMCLTVPHFSTNGATNHECMTFFASPCQVREDLFISEEINHKIRTSLTMHE